MMILLSWSLSISDNQHYLLIFKALVSPAKLLEPSLHGMFDNSS